MTKFVSPAGTFPASHKDTAKVDGKDNKTQLIPNTKLRVSIASLMNKNDNAPNLKVRDAVFNSLQSLVGDSETLTKVDINDMKWTNGNWELKKTRGRSPNDPKEVFNVFLGFKASLKVAAILHVAFGTPLQGGGQRFI